MTDGSARSAAWSSTSLHTLMQHYADQHPVSHRARLVSAPSWQEDRPVLIRTVAEQQWLSIVREPTALTMAELEVLPIEACAGQWTPEQCRISAIRIDGRLVMSLVCSMEGSTAWTA